MEEYDIVKVFNNKLKLIQRVTMVPKIHNLIINFTYIFEEV